MIDSIFSSCGGNVKNTKISRFWQQDNRSTVVMVYLFLILCIFVQKAFFDALFQRHKIQQAGILDFHYDNCRIPENRFEKDIS